MRHRQRRHLRHHLPHNRPHHHDENDDVHDHFFKQKKAREIGRNEWYEQLECIPCAHGKALEQNIFFKIEVKCNM